MIPAYHATARRRPGEMGGKYFRMATEGIFTEFDGVELKQGRPRWGLDLNRNYPGDWHAANQQNGPGPFGLEKKLRFVFRTDSTFKGESLAELTVETERAGTASMEILIP